MDKLLISNPFVVGKYVSDKYFCDREAETDFLVKQIVNGRNVALISPRRMGKTGLIQHLFNQNVIKESYHTFFVDIYAATSIEEFVFLFGKAIFETLKPHRALMDRFFKIFSSLRVGFKMDALTGEIGFNISLGDIKTPNTTLDEIFEYLESADKPCIVAIDEFQQISTYEKQNLEALLRTKIQQCRNSSFIFSGSKRHLMSKMFNSSSKPFYQSSVSMGLDPIPYDVYKGFVSTLFAEYGKSVDAAVIRHVYDDYDGCTWFVQMMMNELFALTDSGQTCGVESIAVAIDNIIKVQSVTYADLLSRLSQKQKLLLQAIAREGKAMNITSSAFIRKHSLPSASSVQSALRPLLNDDIVTQDGSSYRVYDYFFATWLRQEY